MKFVEVGQKIKIEDVNKKSILLNSTIKKVENDRLFVNLPNDNSLTGDSFQEGDDIFCTVNTNFGVRMFNSVIIEYIDNDCVVIDFNPDEYEIFQRRKYVRTNVKLNAMINCNGKMTRVQTVDLGGGGIKFISDETLPLKIYAKMRIALNMNDTSLQINGEILKYDYYKDNEYLFYFVNINENMRTKIIRKCIEEQAYQVRKTMEKYESDNKRS